MRRWKVVAWFSLGFGMLLVATWGMFPEALAQWVGAFGKPPTYWIVGTLVGITRELMHAVTGEVYNWPMTVIPGIWAAGFLGWLALKRPEPDMLRLLPPVLALSLFSSPYGWLFDQSQLIIIQVGLIGIQGVRIVTATTLGIAELGNLARDLLVPRLPPTGP